MDKRYAIFDMDGTITDSMPYWDGLIREYLASQGIHKLPAGLGDSVKHLNITQTAGVLIEKFGLTGSPAKVGMAMNAIMEDHYTRDVVLKPGVVDYLDRLREQKVHMAVASATALPLIRLCLDRLGLSSYFDTLQSCYELGVGKDRPDVYDACTALWGVKREEAAVFEDSFSGAATAKAAGYYVVGIYDELGRDRWEAMQELADEHILDWRQA